MATTSAGPIRVATLRSTRTATSAVSLLERANSYTVAAAEGLRSSSNSAHNSTHEGHSADGDDTDVEGRRYDMVRQRRQ